MTSPNHAEVVRLQRSPVGVKKPTAAGWFFAYNAVKAASSDRVRKQFELRAQQRDKFRYVHLCTCLPGVVCPETRGDAAGQVIHIKTAATVEASAAVDLDAERLHGSPARCARACTRCGFRSVWFLFGCARCLLCCWFRCCRNRTPAPSLISVPNPPPRQDGGAGSGSDLEPETRCQCGAVALLSGTSAVPLDAAGCAAAAAATPTQMLLDDALLCDPASLRATTAEDVPCHVDYPDVAHVRVALCPAHARRLTAHVDRCKCAFPTCFAEPFTVCPRA